MTIYSCNKKLYFEIKSDREKLSKLNPNEFLFIHSKDLVNKLPNGTPLFYVGTKVNFHYLMYYYDGFEKIAIRYKIKLSELNPQQTFEYKSDSLMSFSHPVYIQELKQHKEK